MALGGITIAWDETDPANSKNLGLGAGDIRSTKSNLRGALDSEHHFDSAGGAGSGAHRKGSAVVHYGAASAISSSDTEGRLMVTSDTSVMHHVGSTDTMIVGGRHVVFQPSVKNIAGSNLSSKVTQHWAMETGLGIMKHNSATTTITFKQTYIGATTGGLNVTLSVNPSFEPIAALTALPLVSALAAGTMTISNWNLSTGTIGTSGYSYYFDYVVSGLVAN
jgi:hypothetical protein